MGESKMKTELCECGYRRRSIDSTEATLGDCDTRLCARKFVQPPSREEFDNLENKVAKLEELLKEKVR